MVPNRSFKSPSTRATPVVRVMLASNTLGVPLAGAVPRFQPVGPSALVLASSGVPLLFKVTLYTSLFQWPVNPAMGVQSSGRVISSVSI